MATVVIENPTNEPEAADTGYMRQNTQIFAARTGFFMIGINNMNNAAAPSVLSGSLFEMNGALYKCSGNEGIGGALGNGKCYVYAVPGAGGATFMYSTGAPAWNTPKGGWYNGNNRAILRFEYKDGAFNDKVLMGDFNYDAILEAMKKMAGFDIPPDSAARTMVFQKTTQGESSITLPEGMYEVRMRGGPGGKGGDGGDSHVFTFTHRGEPGKEGLPGQSKCGFFKVAGGPRTVYANIGIGGINGDNGTSNSYNTPGRGGNGGVGGSGEIDGGPGGNGAPGQTTSEDIDGDGGIGGIGADKSVGIAGLGKAVTLLSGGKGGDGGKGAAGGMGGVMPAGPYAGAGGGGGGSAGAGISISETLVLSGGREPSASGAAVEIYRVTV
jgi:hypothetical protein